MAPGWSGVRVTIRTSSPVSSRMPTPDTHTPNGHDPQPVTRVVVTRAREQAVELVDRLEQLGYDVVVCPLIEIEPLGDGAVDVAGYAWAIVTSAHVPREPRPPMP